MSADSLNDDGAYDGDDDSEAAINSSRNDLVSGCFSYKSC